MKQNLLSCFVLVFVVLTRINHGECCPVHNISMEHLLGNNSHLRAVYDELGPMGFLTAEGLRDLLTKILVRTTCPQMPNKIEKLADISLNPDHVHEHGKEDQEHDHAEHDHHNHKDDHVDHDHRNHEHDTSDYDHNHENHNHDEHDHEHLEHSDHDTDHGALIDTFDHNVKKIRENMISPEESKSNYKNIEQENNLEEREDHKKGEVMAIPTEEKSCNLVEEILSRLKLEQGQSLPPEDFLHICPAILNSLLGPPCPSSSNSESLMTGLGLDSNHGYDHQGHNHHHSEKGVHGSMTKDAWLAAILSLILIGLIAFCCIMVIPVIKKSRYYVLINHFLLALAVGSLAGDALIHLLPHALTMETKLSLNGHLVHALYGFTSFAGILLFLLLERAHDLFGHKHSHGHSHDTSATVDGDDLIKEIGIISAELNEAPGQRFDKIGEKLSQHSKHSSFVFGETNSSPSDPPRGCFESCPPNLGTGIEDANGNSGNIDSMICKPRIGDHNSGSIAECERLVNSHTHDKNEQIISPKATHATIPPPPLVVQNSPPKSLVRQDSNNFNMVLQEYHVGHHGHSHHGHSHVTESDTHLHELMILSDSTVHVKLKDFCGDSAEQSKKDSLRTMILLGDGMHSFMDGMAIGAAFGTSLTGGIATAIAVLCHELPHKVGDFAILFEMGMKRRQAMKMVLVLWILSFLGLALGVSIGSIKAVSPWIYCFTAGVFLYLALVDLLSELSINDTSLCKGTNQMGLQICGMLLGALIMLIIAIYEHDLEHLLERAF